jgi:hypothetical protein
MQCLYMAYFTTTNIYCLLSRLPFLQNLEKLKHCVFRVHATRTVNHAVLDHLHLSHLLPDWIRRKILLFFFSPMSWSSVPPTPKAGRQSVHNVIRIGWQVASLSPKSAVLFGAS